MRFLIIGLGSIGTRHLNVIKNIGSHEVLVYKSTDRRLESEEVPDKVFSNLNTALDQDLDGVLISNITNLHVSTALKVAEFGLPIFIEKPLSNSLDDIDILKKIIKKNKVEIMVGYNILFHPAIKKIKQLLIENKIGDVVSAKAQFGSYLPSWHPWENYKDSYAAKKEQGGGVVFTSIHEINYLIHLFGRVDIIKALIIDKNILGINSEEGVEILFRHKTGVVSNIHLNFFQRPDIRFLEIIGTEGTIWWDFWKPFIKCLFTENDAVIKLGTEPNQLLNKSYQDELEHFINICKGTEKSKIKFEDAIYDVEVALDIIKEMDN